MVLPLLYKYKMLDVLSAVAVFLRVDATLSAAVPDSFSFRRSGVRQSAGGRARTHTALREMSCRAK